MFKAEILLSIWPNDLNLKVIVLDIFFFLEIQGGGREGEEEWV